MEPTRRLFGAQPAEWGILWAHYDANHVEYGPYWVMVDGVGRIFWYGIAFGTALFPFVVYQRMTWGSGTGGGTDPTLEAIMAILMQSLQL